MTERPPTRAAWAARPDCRGGVAGAGVGLAGVYGIGDLQAQCGRRRRLPGRGRNGPAAGAAGAWRNRGVNAVGTPRRVPDLAFRDGSGKPIAARRLSRPHRSPEPLGDLVRALPQGNAGARPAAGPDRRPGLRGGRDQHRYPRSGEAAGLPDGCRNHRSSLITPTDRQCVPGPEGDRQGLRHADHDPDRPHRAARSAILAGPAEWASEDAIKLTAAVRLAQLIQR